MQKNCIFPGRYAPLTYYEDLLKATLMARNAREIYNFFALNIIKHLQTGNTPHCMMLDMI